MVATSRLGNSGFKVHPKGIEQQVAGALGFMITQPSDQRIEPMQLTQRNGWRDDFERHHILATKESASEAMVSGLAIPYRQLESNTSSGWAPAKGSLALWPEPSTRWMRFWFLTFPTVVGRLQCPILLGHNSSGKNEIQLDLEISRSVPQSHKLKGRNLLDSPSNLMLIWQAIAVSSMPDISIQRHAALGRPL